MAEPEELKEEVQVDKIHELETILKEEKNRCLRLMADFNNYKKKINSEREEIVKFANEAFVLAILPAIDNFERAMISIEKMKDTNTEELIKGIALVKKQMEDNLERLGVKSIESIGKPFDPHYHEAVMKKENEKHPENTVLEEMQKGYTLHDKVIRPAMVIVSTKKREGE